MLQKGHGVGLRGHGKLVLLRKALPTIGASQHRVGAVFGQVARLLTSGSPQTVAAPKVYTYIHIDTRTYYIHIHV